MEESKMKNMIVLKDLPSNIVDEAFVILKPNKKINYEDHVKNVAKQDKQIITKYEARDYLVNEAQMIISDYLSNIENKKKFKEADIKQLEKRYKRLKTLTYILGFTVVLNALTVIF